MDRWRCVRTAIVIAAAAVSLCVRGPASRADDARFIYFIGADLWRGGYSGHNGLMWSPGGVDSDGFMLKALLSAGSYKYTSGALGNATVRGREIGAQILPGWRFQQDRLEVKVFAGLHVADHRLTPDDVSAGLRGGYTGARAEVNVWYEPTPQTMLAVDASASTIGSTYSVRAAYGWRVLDRFYLGPEISGFTCVDYGQARVGVHAIGFHFRTFEWSAAAGFAQDSDERAGAYGRFGFLKRY